MAIKVPFNLSQSKVFFDEETNKYVMIAKIIFIIYILFIHFICKDLAKHGNEGNLYICNSNIISPRVHIEWSKFFGIHA